MSKAWKELQEYLPAGWEEKAKETNALLRSRQIKTAEDLLALNFLYLTEAGSYQATSGMMRLTSGIELNKNATRKRIMASGDWLRWMAQGVCLKQGFSGDKPEWLEGKHVFLVDASDIPLKESKGSDYRLHYCFDLFAFQCEHMEITANTQGETLTRYAVSEDGIYIADRIYGTITGMEYVRGKGGHFILRCRSKAFQLYNEAGEKLDWLENLRGLKELESKSFTCFYKTAQGQKQPLRIVAMRKSERSMKDTQRKLARRANRKQMKPATPQTMAFNEYIVLATNLDYPEERILALYRARWQIELVFRRLKSLFGFGEVPGSNPNSVKAWFYGKLLLAAVCESIAQQAAFSPTAGRKADNYAGTEPME